MGVDAGHGFTRLGLREREGRCPHFGQMKRTNKIGGLAMRNAFLFIAGIVVGLAVDAAVAQNGSPNRGLVGLNHVGVAVPNLDEALNYYTKTLGFPEAFRSIDEKGNVTLVYVQISKNTFVELQPANGRPLGINHFGIHVENMAQATSMFKQRGANLSETRVSPTKAILYNITDPNGVSIEFAEFSSEFPSRRVM